MHRDGEIDSFQSQMGGEFWMEVPGYPYPFKPDFKLQKGVDTMILEAMSKLHLVTFKGRPNTRRIRKDEAKKHALLDAGYRYCAVWEKELPIRIKTWSIIRERRDRVKLKIKAAFKLT